MEHQQRQEGPLLPPFQLERMSLHEHLERAESAELDVSHLCLASVLPPSVGTCCLATCEPGVSAV